MKKILILLLICLIKISSSCQSNLNEKINIFTSSKIVNHSTLKDYYQFYDKKKKGYGLKTEKDTSKIIVEPIFESIGITDGFIRIYFDLNNKFNSELNTILKRRISKKLNGVVILYADSLGNIQYGLDDEILISHGGNLCHLIPIKNNNKIGFIDYEKKLKVPFQYDEISFRDTNLIWIKLNNKCGLIDTNGNFIAPIIYDFIDFPNIQIGEIAGIINNKGKIVINGFTETYPIIDLSSLQMYYCGSKDHKRTFFNANGDTIITFNDERIYSIDSNNIITIYKNDISLGKTFFRYYNLKNKRYFSGVFEDMKGDFKHFRYGLAIINNNGMSGVINNKEELILSCEYDNIDIGKKHIIASKNGKSYLFDKNGKTIKEYPYNRVDFKSRGLNEDELFVYSYTGMGLIKLDGSILLQPEFDTSFYDDCSRIFLTNLKTLKVYVYNYNSKKIIDIID